MFFFDEAKILEIAKPAKKWQKCTWWGLYIYVHASMTHPKRIS